METIERLREVLETELQDRKLQEMGCTVDLYFDTVDVQRAVLGMWDFVTDRHARPLEIDREEFDRDASLVAALLAAGWLGRFRMLPPHQAEFLRHLEHGVDFQETKRLGRIPEQEFLDALDVLPGT